MATKGKKRTSRQSPLIAVLTWLKAHPILGIPYAYIDGTLVDYVRHHGPVYAAAISFYALLSMIPLVVLFVSASAYLLDLVTVSGATSKAQLLDEVVTQLKRVVPYLGADFEVEFRSMIQKRARIGAAGLFALLLSSSQVFRALEFTFARIFEPLEKHRKGRMNAVPRNVVLSKLLFGAFLVALLFLFVFLRFMWFAVDWALQFVSPQLARAIGNPLAESGWAPTILTVFSVIFGFAALVKTFSSVSLKWSHALFGGVVYYGAFKAAHVAYEVYLGEFARLGVMYGSFTAIIVLLLWIFFMASLLILCGELVKTIAIRARRRS